MAGRGVYVTRRSWTATEKRGIVDEAFGGDDSVSAVARRHGLQTHQIYRWRDAFRAEGGEPEPSGFMPVEVLPFALPAPASSVQTDVRKARRSRSERSGNIEIRLPDGTMIKVPVTAGAACIAGLIKGLARGTS